ncbi:ABC transporter permease [Actinoplanes sp. KI2]|uniref:ABC transporter permease n=1 Tax=Actinoplanes sp. KI2 TaxID=2983315 RepID=UPI0021D5EE0C|nr:ABC transporter permease [Actinoplanes sp. KI2]MCU7725315.1 ABC transporter permease [Actinoplanes sp. KI2]
MTTSPDRTRFRHLLTAEWIKLRSLRSTPWALLVSALAIIGANVSAAVADYTDFPSYPASMRADFLSSALFDSFTDLASQLVMLAAGSIGAIIIVSEFSTGLIRTTFAAVPNRRAVMGAKVIVLSAVMTGYGAIVSSISFVAVQAILAGRSASAPVSDPHAMRVIVASTLLVPVCALTGLAVGSVVRHSASSIVGTVVVLLLLPLLFVSKQAWSAAIKRSLPHSAWYHLSAEQLAGPMNGIPTTNVGAWAVFAAWAVAAAAVAILAPNWRDV